MRLRPHYFSCIAAACLLVVAGCSKKDPLEKLIQQGDQFYQAGDFQAASDLYKTVLAKVSNDPRALVRLGRVAVREGRPVTGYFLIRETIDKVPPDPDLLLAYGLANHAVGKTIDARSSAKKVIELQPANEEALLLLVETCLTTRDNNETRRIIEQLQAGKPDTAIYHVALGELEVALQKPAEGEDEFRRALELDPQNAAAHSRLGNVLLKRGEREKGAALLEKAAGLSSLRSPRRINYIDYLIAAGRIAEAKAQLAIITGKAPDYVPALSVAMKLNFQLGQLDESDALAQRIVSLDRSNYEARMQRVAVRLQKNDLDGVIAELKQVETVFDRSPQVKYQLALAHLQKDEVFSAEQYIQQALRIAPQYDDGIVFQAEIDINKGNFAGVVTPLTSLLGRRPQIAQAYVLLAQAHRALGEPAKSLAILQTLAASFPRYPNGAYLVGGAYLEAGRTKDAEEAFEQALKISDQYWPALEMLVHMELAAGQVTAAATRIEIALQKHPDAGEPLLLRARVRVAQNDMTGAEADLLKGIASNPTRSFPYLLLSRIYLAAGRVQESVEKLSALAATKPSATVYLQLGLLHAMQRNFPEARASYEKALTLDPKFVPALNNLAVIYAEQLHQLDRAEALVKSARELAPKDAVVADTLGWILTQKGQYEPALRLLQAAGEQMPSNPEVQYHIAMAQYYSGQNERARLTFQNLVKTADPALMKVVSAKLAVLAIEPATAESSVRATLEAVIKEDPQDPNALTRLAAIEAREGLHAQASQHYEAALRINPRNLQDTIALAELYAGTLQKTDRARELAKQARNAAPNDTALAWKAGKLLFRAEEYAAAGAAFQDASRAYAENGEFLYDLARSQFSLGREEEAANTLEKACQMKAPPGAARMAHLLALAQKTPLAAQDLVEVNAVLVTETNDVPALMVKALAAEQNKQADAARIYENVLRIYPQFVPAMRRLAVIAGEQTGDDNKAEEWSLKVLKIQPDDPDANHQIGAVAFRKGAYADAVRYLNQAVRRRANHAETQYLLGMTYFQLKNGSQAQAALERAVQLGLPPQEAGEATRVLEALSRGQNL